MVLLLLVLPVYISRSHACSGGFQMELLLCLHNTNLHRVQEETDVFAAKPNEASPFLL